MKANGKLLSISILILINIRCFSQYDSLVVENKVWSEIVYIYNFSGGLDAILTTHYKFEGDTTLGGLTYKILYSNYSDSLMRNWNIQSFFREDSKKVYERINEEEYLRYDFSLLPGDSLCIGNPADQCDFYMQPDSVDTIFVEGKLRKRIFFQSNLEDVWIEGLGSIYRPFEPFATRVDIDYDLLCCQQDDLVIYKNPGYNTCYIYYITDIKTINSRNNNKIIISPNPWSDFTTISIIDSNPSGYKTLYIINQLGKILKEAKVSNNLIRIEREDLSEGSYFLLLIDSAGNIATEKLVVY